MQKRGKNKATVIQRLQDHSKRVRIHIKNEYDQEIKTHKKL